MQRILIDSTNKLTGQRRSLRNRLASVRLNIIEVSTWGLLVVWCLVLPTDATASACDAAHEDLVDESVTAVPYSATTRSISDPATTGEPIILASSPKGNAATFPDGKPPFILGEVEKISDVQLGFGLPFGSQPRLAVDRRGVAHVVWAAGVSNDSITYVYYSSKRPGGSWATPIRLSDELPGLDPDIAIDSAGSLHVTWRGPGICYASNVNH